jgi:LysM repeat protein
VAGSTSVQKAKLLVEKGSTIDCWFNPSTLQLSRAASWKFRKTANQGAPNASYLGGGDERLKLDLLLHAQFNQDGSDVSLAISGLFALLQPSITLASIPQRKRPPKVTFAWGKFVSFAAVCESVTVNEELFDVNGAPLRASVSLELRQAEPEAGQATPPGQNPTTRAVQAHHSHTIRYGDSLASIAFTHYGTPKRWREIAEANGIDDPLRLKVGNPLVVPVVEP